MEPCGILRNFANDAKLNLQRSDLMRTTGLQKQLATAVQAHFYFKLIDLDGTNMILI